MMTSIRMTPEDILSGLRLADEQMRVLGSIPWPGIWVIALFWVAVWGSMLAYLLTLRPYFVDD
jgi:hypothetical protein